MQNNHTEFYSVVIIIQCVQQNFYNNKNWHAFNFGYLTNTTFLKNINRQIMSNWH